LLTGRVPFPGGTLLQKLNRHQNEPPPAVEACRSDVPPKVAGIMRKLMAKNPAERYQTPAELVAALSLPPEDERTIVLTRRAPVAAEASGDTLLSPFAHLRTNDSLPAAPSPQVKEGRWLLLGVLAGCGVFIGVVALLVQLLLEPGGKKQQTVDTTSSSTAPKNVDYAWLRSVAGLTHAKQVEMVAARLKQLNPGFDGQVTPRMEAGEVTELRFSVDEVTDVSPVRALAGLTQLACVGSDHGKGRLADLSPLKGMKLTRFMCPATEVADLTPLKGMLLVHLACEATKVSDLSPLAGMPLSCLACEDSRVSDLAPLKGMPLRHLDCGNTRVSDLSPLKGMPLAVLFCGRTKVTDLSPLKGLPLTLLFCSDTNVSD